MYLSKYLLAVWLLATFASVALVFYRRRQVTARQRRVRALERTVEKLKRKNGKLWYELMGQTNERTDLTVTHL
jgi:N-glycosylase/DNA lyase